MNFAKEYREFEEEMRQLKARCLAGGCSEEEIQKYYDMRREDLNRDLAYKRRSVPLYQDIDDFEGEGQNPLNKDFLDALSVEMETPSVLQYWWLDRIENEDLLKVLLSLSDDELAVIDLSVYQGYSQQTIGKIMESSQPKVSRTWRSVKKNIKKSLESE